MRLPVSPDTEAGRWAGPGLACAALAATLLLVGGCGTDSAAPSAPSTTPSATSPAPPSAPAPATPPPSTSVAATTASVTTTTTAASRSATPADPASFPGTVTTTGFTLPSQNISCGFSSRDGGDVLCQVEKFGYTPSPAGDCYGGGFWGNAVQLTAGGVRFVCAGGVESGGPTLDYGRQLTVGSVVCTSGEADLTCKDAATGHGFSLARSQYRFF